MPFANTLIQAGCPSPQEPMDLIAALQQSHFVPFFQPQVNLKDGAVVGFEVLARCKHPVKGILLPAAFIPLAEKEGVIDAVMFQILEKALFASSRLPEGSTLSINIAAKQLLNQMLPDQLYTLAGITGFSLPRLVIEVTESAPIGDDPLARKVITELKSMGCMLSLDDFGSGFSNLEYLQTSLFDQLKIDRRFVNCVVGSKRCRMIAYSIVQLGLSLGLSTIAEGIETMAQAEVMRSFGCELGQGFLFGRPVAADDLATSIAADMHALWPLVSGRAAQWIGRTVLDLHQPQDDSKDPFDDYPLRTHSDARSRPQ